MSNLTTIEFRGDTLFAVERDDGVFVAVKPISDQLGLDWSGQHQRIKRTPALLEGMGVIPIPSVGGAQETVCLRLNLINGWLFTIDSARVKPELRERVLAYQRECYDVLADHFLGPRAAAQPIRRPDPIEDSNLRVEEHKLSLVREMRQIGGPAKAHALWRKLGLIDVEPAQQPLDTAGPRAIDPDTLISDVREFLRHHREIGIVPAAEAGDSGTWNRRGIVGFVTHGHTIALTDEGWRLAIDGRDPAAAADALDDAGLLVRGEHGRRKANMRIGGRLMRVYRLRAEILETT